MPFGLSAEEVNHLKQVFEAIPEEVLPRKMGKPASREA